MACCQIGSGGVVYIYIKIKCIMGNLITKYELQIKENINIDDNNETVTCRICGEQCKRVYGRHLKHSHNNISTKEYKELFDGAPITALSDKSNTSKNSGQHMKQEKYKKMFSEKVKGEKNPMHRSKTTEQFRKSVSPFSKEFYKKRYPDMSDKEIKEKISKLVTDFTDERLLPSNKEYWIKLGYSEKESIRKVSKRQTTFSKEICIEKHGSEKGTEIWLDRQEKWQDSLNVNGNLKMGYSQIGQELFDILQKYIGSKKCLYATNNGEFKLRKDNGHGIWLYDFKYLNKIIEYQGDMYHANPKLYEADDNPHPFRKELSAKEIWEKDKNKRISAESNGYEILYIWDSEFRKVGYKKRMATIQKCLDFILS
jgi:hypothetical protein